MLPLANFGITGYTDAHATCFAKAAPVSGLIWDTFKVHNRCAMYNTLFSTFITKPVIIKNTPFGYHLNL